MKEKLVRDNVPALITAIEDRQPVFRVADDTGYSDSLMHKLLEEAQEVVDAPNKCELTEELADLLEVIDAIKALHNIDEDTLQYWKKRKALLSGGFKKRHILVIEE